MKKFLIILLSLSLFLCVLVPLGAFAEENAEMPADPVGTLSGETDRKIQYVKTSDGKDTGVQIHTITLSGTYGNREVWVATGDLSNTNLSLEVINGGQYMVSGASMMKASADYNAAHPGQTVLAAVNGDLWMTNVHSNSQVTTKVLKVPRGFTMIDGEIWATQQIGMENYVATNGEKGTTSPDKASFGITASNQPLVGIPVVDITLTNQTKNKSFTADGINRLPAYNSLIVYNYRCNDTNYALADAYEIEIEVDSSAFTLSGQVSGKVKAIYPANSSTRPTFTENNVVLTARGNRINDLKNNFAVGDTVSFSLNLTDKLGNTELWKTVEDAIGGHMIVLNDGKIFSPNGNNSEYPTTLIGYKNDGQVMLLTINAQEPGKYLGLNFTKGVQFCQELGYNSVFYMDGGGSATFVSLEEGDSGTTYVARNHGSDPLKDDAGNVIGSSQRAVINGVGFVWNDQPVCQAQGSLDHIEFPLFNYSDLSPEYVSGELMSEFMGGQNSVDTYYDAEQGGLVIKANANSADPFASFDMTSLSRISADEYKYIVVCAKTDKVSINSSVNSAIFYACGATMGAVGGQTVWYQIKGGGVFKYYIIDMTGKPGWAGNINSLRFDVVDGAVNKDDSVVFSMIAFAKTKADAQKLTEGFIPEGGIADFGAFKQKLTDVYNVKKNLDTVQKTAAGVVEQSLTALNDAKSLENTNEKTPALYAEATALYEKLRTGMSAIDTAKTSAQALTNEAEQAQALLADANAALTAMQADATALTAKLDELAKAAAETEPPTTEAPTEEITTAPEQSGGCKNALGAGMAVILLATLALFATKKKD